MLSSLEVLALKLFREGEDKTKQECKIFEVLSRDKKVFTSLQERPFSTTRRPSRRTSTRPSPRCCMPSQTSQIIVSLDLRIKYLLICSV